MKIAFTICTASYLPYAKSLADSLVDHNPGYRFFIALLDTYKGYDTAFFAPHTVVPVTEMAFSTFDEMAGRYNVFELSCALKPYVAEYLFQQHHACQAVFYFDSDILVYNRLTVAEELLQNHSLLLTPHINGGAPGATTLSTELGTLQAGIYNAGFFGISKTAESSRFLHWWKERLRYHCRDDFSKGLFVDQLWLNHAPIFFKNTFILNDPGYNLAYWNFPERRITAESGVYNVNGCHPLVFFHYSGYDIQQPATISKHLPSHQLECFADYIPLFENYRALFAQNDAPGFSSLPATIGKPVFKKPLREKNFFKRKFKKLFKRSP